MTMATTMKKTIETNFEEQGYRTMLSAFYESKLLNKEMGSFFHRSNKKRQDKWVNKMVNDDISKNGIPEVNPFIEQFEKSGREVNYHLYFIPNVGLTSGLSSSMADGFRKGLKNIDPELCEEVSYAEFYNNAKPTNQDPKLYCCKNLDEASYDLLLDRFGGLNTLYVDVRLDLATIQAHTMGLAQQLKTANDEKTEELLDEIEMWLMTARAKKESLREFA